MSDQNGKSETSGEQGERRDFGWWVLWLVLSALLVVLGAVFYRWLLLEPKPVQEAFGSLGDAIAPLSAAATTGALLAALWSVRLQREELRLQRQEMVDSRKELQRAADAQRDLAKAQQEANRRSFQLVYTQLLQSLASADVGLTNAASSRIAEVVKVNTRDTDMLISQAEKNLQQTRKRLAGELETAAALLNGEIEEEDVS